VGARTRACLIVTPRGCGEKVKEGRKEDSGLRRLGGVNVVIRSYPIAK